MGLLTVRRRATVRNICRIPVTQLRIYTMPVTLVLGSQWGDEGKGKLVDILASSASMVCRAAGGNNAGHTIVVNDVTYDFHILPSGLIIPSCNINLIGTG